MERQTSTSIKNEKTDEIYLESKHTCLEDPLKFEEPGVDVTDLLEVKLEVDASDHNCLEDPLKFEEPGLDVTDLLEVKLEVDGSDRNMAPSSRYPSNTVRLAENSGESCSISFEETANQGVVHDEVEKRAEDFTKHGSQIQDVSPQEDNLFSARPQCNLREREFCNFICSFCLKSFSSKYELIMHVFIHIDGVQPPTYVCRSCGKIFQSDDCLNKHLECSDSDQAVSTGNNQKFSSSDDQGNVSSTEGKRGLYVTELTDMQSLSKETRKTPVKSFDTHTMIHNAEQQDSSDTNGTLSQTGQVHTVDLSVKKLHKCDFCSKFFIQLERLKHHTLTHTGIKTHKCDTCGKSFTHLGTLKNHILIHTGMKPHKCDICGKAFTRLGHLKSHTLSHTGTKVHKCDICGKSFTHLGNMKIHTLTHTGIKPHKCDTCGKSFTQLGTLKSHILIHTGMKPHKCDTCGKCFTELGHLRTHTLTHTGMKPHKCDICGQSFTQMSNLKSHTLIHTGIKSHKCQICSKSFTRLGRLKSHTLTHTGMEPHKCDICGKSFTEFSSLKRHTLKHTHILE